MISDAEKHLGYIVGFCVARGYPREGKRMLEATIGR